jgi:hypothetical protein
MGKHSLSAMDIGTKGVSCQERIVSLHSAAENAVTHLGEDIVHGAVENVSQRILLGGLQVGRLGENAIALIQTEAASLFCSHNIHTFSKAMWGGSAANQ